MGNNEVRAPYNFVPFSDEILIRYAAKKDLPPHDKIDQTLKSGEIHFTMTAETPVFVSDGNKDENGELHFFRGANGKYMIPGSTIRGMVRENMQILGFGLIRPGEDMEDAKLYFRDVASANKSVNIALNKYYRGALDVKTEKTAGGKTVSIPRRVKAGFLRNENGTYFLKPITSGYLRISRKHKDMEQFKDDSAKTIPVGYTASAEGNIKRVVRISKMTPDMKAGTLMFTGKLAGKSHPYIFPKADGEPFKIKESDILSYQADWEARRKSLKAAYYDPEFWNLPNKGEEKPVFYIEYDGHTYFGMSLFLRIEYRHTLKVGLPKNHEDKLKMGNLDYPHSILGYADDKNAYRSRVSFGDMELQGKKKEGELIQVILGEPKPSYYPGYVKEGKDYNKDDFELRGYKQYWLKDTKDFPIPEKKNLASNFHPLPKGSVFSGVIRFKNLHEDELGLLLWCLCLKDDCYQSIGMGKPYGYGRMKLVVDDLLEYDFSAMYRPDGLSAAPVSRKDQISRYIKRYDTFAMDKLHIKTLKSIENRDEIKDFFYLRSTIRVCEDKIYMDPKEHKKKKTPLPSVQTIREG